MAAYTTFEENNVTLEARIGPLFVLNSDARLDYECPPDQYNGFDYRFSYCQLAKNNTMMSVAYVANDMMHGLDVILSGSPFPETLEVNQPPFGAARFTLSTPISMKSTGSLTICDGDQLPTCTGVDEKQTLDLKGIVYSAFGSFSLQGIGYSSPSVWIHDDGRQLLHLTAGQAQGFWFNESGFYLADYQDQTCVWFSNCNFACEVYNYDSRFMDFIGIWNVTGKHGAMDDKFAPVLANVYLGNAIDAAGVFPCLMYISAESGFYLGLDKLDTTVGTGGSSFWYSRTVSVPPDFLDYPLPTDMGCPGTMDEWLTLGVTETAPMPPDSPGGSSDNLSSAAHRLGGFSLSHHAASSFIVSIVSLLAFLLTL